MGQIVSEMQRTTLARGCVALWWLGQASFAVKGSRVVYIDPFLSDGAARLRPAPLRPHEVTNADLVLVTHEHLDHLDPATLGPLAQASPRARVLAPALIVDQVERAGVPRERVVPITVGETWTDGDVRVTPVPAMHALHPAVEGHRYYTALPGERGYRFVGYVVETNGVTLYHSGDTVMFEGLIEAVRPLRPDVALLPINGRDYFREQQDIAGNLDAAEAAEVGVAIGAEVIVPMHYGMFARNTVPASRFVEYVESRYPEQGVLVLPHGRRFVYAKG